MSENNNKESDNNFIPNININQGLYPIIRAFKNINPNNVNIIDMIWDGNYLYLSISQFINSTKEFLQNIRNQIYKKALNSKHFIPNIYIETEYTQD